MIIPDMILDHKGSTHLTTNLDLEINTYHKNDLYRLLVINTAHKLYTQPESIHVYVYTMSLNKFFHNHLLEVLPCFRFPEYKCLGLAVGICRSDSPAFPRRAKFL